MSNTKWYSMNAGRINTLKDNDLITLFTFIPDVGRKDINHLLRVSKRFNILAASDSFWSQLLKQSGHEHWIGSVWVGEGREGCEESEWQRMKDDAGLPLMNMFKIHWMSQNTSRLKIYYGSLTTRSDAPPSFFDFFAPSVNSIVKRKIVIIGHENGSTYKQSHKLLQQLHYLVPESATRYHLNSQCRPLQRGFVLTEIEPSPLTSRTRNLFVDPGTRVETHAEHNLLVCRRVGDERLSFVQFAFNAQRFQAQQEHYSGIINGIFDKAIGNIMVVEYHSPPEGGEGDDELAGHEAQLRAVYAQLKTLYGVVDTRSVPSGAFKGSGKMNKSLLLSDMEVDRSYAARHGSDTPLLVIVAIHLPKAVTAVSPVRSSGTKSDWQAVYRRDFIRNITSAVSHMTRDVLGAQSGASPVRQSLTGSRVWYVQPVDADSALNQMRAGVFAGTNWLLRAIQAGGGRI